MAKIYTVTENAKAGPSGGRKIPPAKIFTAFTYRSTRLINLSVGRSPDGERIQRSGFSSDSFLDGEISGSGPIPLKCLREISYRK